MLDQAVDQIHQAHRILLISHTQPDGDAVGSLLALYHTLSQIGKKVTIVLPDKLPDIFSFTYSPDISTSSSYPAQEDIDLCLVMDVSDLARTGFANEIKLTGNEGKLISIDHHPLGDIAKATSLIVHDQEASSTAEIIYDLITRLSSKITPVIATCILLGIYTDTGGFQYSNTTPRTLDIASELMKRGARLQAISSNLSHTKTLSHLKLLGISLERLQSVNKPTPYSYSIITHDDIAAQKARPEDLHGIINDINTLPASIFALLLTEEDKGTVKGTLRSGMNSRFNVRRLAKLLGGGGHPRAAGFTVLGSIVMTEEGYWKIVKQNKT